MKHLIISRELPPAPYAVGGIGTYVANIARLLAEQGDTVHVIGERWSGAPKQREVQCDGRLIIHRIGAEDLPQPLNTTADARLQRELQGLRNSCFPEQWFAWSAAFLAERLVQEEGVDLIEAQEWEAPLYYFLLRRALGLGPDRRPPCVVHLHSPSVFINHYSGTPVAPASLGSMVRMEQFCIQSADALVCPSRSLAAQAARHYRVAPEAIRVIPLPMGIAPRLDRDEAVWSDGSICFVGRLEARKGIIEWVEAAMRVAREDPTVHFDFVGADNWDLRKGLETQIGRELAPRFRFHGSKSKSELAGYLARAKVGVVPSRWENFPNVCIEAMSSGLPVIATRFGGMVEMLEDGRTGWLAEDTGIAGMVDSLAEALRRAQATSAARKAEMGAAAAQSIRRICDNDTIVEAHHQFRRAIVDCGARSLAATASPDAPPASANVVIRTETIEEAQAVLASLAAQSAPARIVAVVHRQAAPQSLTERLQAHAGTELVLHHAPGETGTRAWNAGVALLASRPSPDFWLFLDGDDRLADDCLAQMAGVFSRRPDVGLVTPWTDRVGPGGYLDARPLPSLAQQMTGNDVSPASGFRACAIGEGAPFKPGLPREYDVWALANDVLGRGWVGVTLPILLAERPATQASRIHETSLRAIRADTLAAFDREDTRLALQIVDHYVPLTQLPGVARDNSKELRLAILRSVEAILFRPRHVLRRLLAFAPWPASRGPVQR